MKIETDLGGPPQCWPILTVTGDEKDNQRISRKKTGRCQHKINKHQSNKLRWYPQQQERIHSSVMCIGFLNFKFAHGCIVVFIG